MDYYDDFSLTTGRRIKKYNNNTKKQTTNDTIYTTKHVRIALEKQSKQPAKQKQPTKQKKNYQTKTKTTY